MTTDLRPDPELAARAERSIPAMSLDPDTLLGAAHRHVRRRTAARIAGSTVAVAALAVLGATLVGHRTMTPEPAQPPTQVARPIGDGAVVEVADGLVAANRPAAKHAPDDRIRPLLGEATWQVDVGLATGNHELVLGAGPAAGGEQRGVASFSSVTAAGTSNAFGGGVWTWGTPSVADGARFAAALPSGEWSEVVVVPTNLRDPHVLLWSTEGFETADGSSVAVELPTFAAPDGQLVAAALGEPSLAASIQSGESGIAFVGTDGRVVQAPCEDMPAEKCPTVDEVPGLGTAIAALTAQPTAQSADVTTLAQGVQATTGLARSSGDAWDTGLRITGSSDDGAESGTVTLVPATEVELTSAREAFDVPATAGLQVRVAGLDDASAFTWTGDDSVDRFPPGTYYPGSLQWSIDDDVRVLAGAVPGSIPGGQVVVWLPRGVVGNDGRRVHVLDVPTFDDPAGSGARVYAIGLDEGVVLSDPASLRDTLVFYIGEATRADALLEGSGQCTALRSECLAAQPDGGAALLAALANRGVLVDDVRPDEGLAPPTGPSSAITAGEGVTAATGWLDGTRLDLGEVNGQRVWLDVPDGTAGTITPTLFVDSTRHHTQPHRLSLSSSDYTHASLTDAVVELGTAPKDGPWRVLHWKLSAHAGGDLPVELPTVERDGRALYGYVARRSSGVFDTLSTVVWVSPEGDVRVRGCEGMTEDECEVQGATPGIFADVRAALD